MSTPANSKNTGTATATSTAGTMGSKLMEGAKNWAGVAVFSIAAIGFFIGSFSGMSNFVGSKDDWNLIKPQITKILILSLMGTFMFIIAALLYFIQDPNKSIYFILTLSCVSLGLSFSALAISAISR